MSQSKLYGLIGYPLSHSYSKKYFTEKFEKEQIKNVSYELFQIQKPEHIFDLLSKYPNIKGLNVTIPYKESIIPFLNEIDVTAKTIGAVNCIRVENSSGTPFLVGFNTDIVGFSSSIKPFLESQHEKALILGTGGAAKAVAYALNEIGIECFFVTRNKTANHINIKSNHLLTYTELNKNVFDIIKLIINTTPIGMFPDITQSPALPYEYLNSSHLLYDAVYNPSETAFLKQGITQKSTVINGLSMLYLQAEASWQIWNK